MTVMALARRLAQQESRALRVWTRHGRLPKCHPLRLPWHAGYVDTNGWLSRDELLPDAIERPEIRRRA